MHCLYSRNDWDNLRRNLRSRRISRSRLTKYVHHQNKLVGRQCLLRLQLQPYATFKVEKRSQWTSRESLRKSRYYCEYFVMSYSYSSLSPSSTIASHVLPSTIISTNWHSRTSWLLRYISKACRTSTGLPVIGANLTWRCDASISLNTLWFVLLSIDLDTKWFEIIKPVVKKILRLTGKSARKEAENRCKGWRNLMIARLSAKNVIVGTARGAGW